MRIAILAWGSLIWDPRELALKNSEKWNEDGPELLIEFSRISNDGRLTLVIDEINGSPVRVLHSESRFSDLGDARQNLAKREGCGEEWIGCCDLMRKEEIDGEDNRNPKARHAIREWCKRKEYDAAIWTALGRRFKEKTRDIYSSEAAWKYLNMLTAEKSRTAMEYINNAPKCVNTEFRRLVDERSGGKR